MKIDVLLEGKPFHSEFGSIGYSTVILLRENGKNILFDCGNRGSWNELVKAMRTLELEPSDITDVVLSHLHYDHVGNLPLFGRARIYMSQTEWETARNAPDDWDCLATVSYIRHECSYFFLKEGDRLTQHIMVMELPGHTKGMIGLKYGDDAILCSDAIKNRYELWDQVPAMGSNDEWNRKTYDRILREAKVIYPGHDSKLEIYHPESRKPSEINIQAANGAMQTIQLPT